MSRPPLRSDEDLQRALMRRVQLLERRLSGGGGGGGGGGGQSFITPTGIVGGTFDPVTGRVLIDAGAGEVRVLGVFSDDCDAYRITYSGFIEGTGGQLRLQMLTDGNGIMGTPSSYSWTNSNAGNGATAVGASTADQNWVPDQWSGNSKAGEIIVLDPRGRTTGKKALWRNVTNAARNAFSTDGSGFLFDNDANNAGGFRLYISGGNGGFRATQENWITIEPVPGGRGSTGGAGGIGSAVYPGMVVAQAAPGLVPAGFLPADGRAVSRTAYAELFNAIGTRYGTGDGSTTFNLPNYNGRSLVGQDTSQTEFATIGQVGGAKTHDHWQTIGADGATVYYRTAANAGSNSKVESISAAGSGTIGGTTGTGLRRYDATEKGSSLTPYAVVGMLIAYTSGGGPAIIQQPSRGTSTDRDIAFGVPTTLAQTVTLANQVPMWFNTERGWWESYFALAGSSGLSARGLAAGQVAGWYPTAAGSLFFHRGKTNGTQAATASPSEVTLADQPQVNRGGFTAAAGSATTVPIGGIYRITGRVYFTGGSANRGMSRIEANGSPIQDESSTRVPGQDGSAWVATMSPRAAGDVLRLAAWASSTDTYSYGTNGFNGSFLEAEYLGPPFA